jgi:hypothetical protein
VGLCPQNTQSTRKRNEKHSLSASFCVFCG